MDDPTRRPPGAWPRDRPIRWRGVARSLTWFLVATVALIAQILLALSILHFDALATDDGDRRAVKLVLTLIWAVLTVAAAWSWILGRWRIVLAPLLTGGFIVVAWYVVTRA